MGKKVWKDQKIPTYWRGTRWVSKLLFFQPFTEWHTLPPTGKEPRPESNKYHSHRFLKTSYFLSSLSLLLYIIIWKSKGTIRHLDILLNPSFLSFFCFKDYFSDEKASSLRMLFELLSGLLFGPEGVSR